MRWCAKHDREYAVACALRNYYRGHSQPDWVRRQIAHVGGVPE